MKSGILSAAAGIETVSIVIEKAAFSFTDIRQFPFYSNNNSQRSHNTYLTFMVPVEVDISCNCVSKLQTNDLL